MAMTERYGLSEKQRKRFLSRVSLPNDEGCMVWSGSLRDGYGQFRVGKTVASAHRVAYELWNGSIPEPEDAYGTVIRHTCDNRVCVAPDHLVSGTQMDNIHDAIDRERMYWFK